jgi:hypothetical protein
MGFIRNIELASDIVSIASGQVPVNLGFRLFSTFFGRKKGLTKAQMKKLMMRKRRMFVDNVIMNHKRLHDKSREKIIDETKAKISSKPSKKKLNMPSNKPEIGPTKSPLKKVKPEQGERDKTHIKGSVDNKNQKSKSEWATKVKENSKPSKEI